MLDMIATFGALCAVGGMGRHHHRVVAIPLAVMVAL
jgi:hypothetical protein